MESLTSGIFRTTFILFYNFHQQYRNINLCMKKLQSFFSYTTSNNEGAFGFPSFSSRIKKKEVGFTMCGMFNCIGIHHKITKHCPLKPSTNDTIIGSKNCIVHIRK